MSAALSYTEPVCLFELHHGEDAPCGSGSDMHAEAQGVLGHDTALLRRLSDESMKDRRRKSRGPSVACNGGIDRYGGNMGFDRHPVGVP